MGPYIEATLFAILVIALFKVFKLVEYSKGVFSAARLSAADMTNKEMSDGEKEKALQTHAKRLFSLFFLITLGAAAAFAIPLALFWAADLMGLVSLDAIFEAALSLEFLTVSTVLLVVACLALKKKKRPADQGLSDAEKEKGDEKFEIRYSTTDKLLHRIAFRCTGIQLNLSELEDSKYSKKLAGISAERPVFITGLPRAGTTLILELCHRLEEFASHCYRDMPFVLLPMMWNGFSSRFRKDDALRERAHGDGMMVNMDSPEAFEEMLWKAFWKNHYREDRIIPWGDEPNGEFFSFFRKHMKKVIAVRDRKAPKVRYISKNNLNISRVGLIRDQLPDALILLPFRDPVQHANELLTQHKNFLKIHKEDPFARAYMKGIGHYDFGENLRPVNFEGWLDRAEHKDPMGLSFWLEYWITAYEHLLKLTGERVRLVCYETLCENPAETLAEIAGFIGVAEPRALTDQASGVWPLKKVPVELDGVPEELLQKTHDLYAILKEAALV